MEIMFRSIINYFFETREFFAGILGPALPWLYVIGFVLSVLFFWGIIYTILGSGYIKRKVDEYADKFGGDVSQIRQMRAWKNILKRLKSAEITNWKLAVLECDALFDEILKHSGYKGADVHERFQQ